MTPGEERLLALTFVPEPRWMTAAMWVLLAVPPCRPLAERLHHWRTDRAVVKYRRAS